MRVITFQPRFHDPIRQGIKRSTIRKQGKRPPPKIGDLLSLRTWTGIPYRSKQATLSEQPCAGVRPIELGLSNLGIWQVSRRNMLLTAAERRELALVEGFASDTDMQHWFVTNHKLAPGKQIEAIQIEW